jgi:signal transduction histidine kinase
VAAVGLSIKIADASYTPAEIGLDAVCGLALIGTGTWALSQPRDRRLGWLFLLTGAAWFAEDLIIAEDGVVDVLGALLTDAALAPLAYLALAFPGSALPDRASRFAVALVCLVALLLSPIQNLTIAVSGPCGDPCGWRIHVAPVVFDAVVTLTEIVGLVAGVLVLVLLVRRYVRSSRPLRRSIGPFMWCALALTALSIADVLLRAVISEESRAGLVAAENIFTAATALGFPFGLLLVRMRRAAAAGMVVELAALRPSQSPRDVLVRALGDPDIELVLFGDAPVAVDAPANRVATPLVAGGRTLGVLVHDPALEDAAELLPAAATALALRLDNERLGAAQSALAEQLQGSRARLVKASDAARRRVERDLHDGAQQRLVLLGLKLGLVHRRLQHDPTMAAAIDELREELDRALSELRDLARGIYPTILESDGLPAALREVANRTAIPTAIDCDDAGRYLPELEAAVYFCCLEGLQNAAKHAGEGAHARVRIAQHDGALTFTIADDGDGFDLADAAPGAGVQNMIDRVGALGGSLRIDTAPGAGTTIAAAIRATPIDDDDDPSPQSADERSD